MAKLEFLRILGKTIKEIRVEKNISLYKISKAAKINYNHLKKIEKGEVDFHTRILDRICKILDINAVDVFKKADL